ncbi:alpha-xenorhabdolysin family binary toxin subunit A [Pseudomonas capeferrum]|uniref:alpha-xenorhabdolysin family binary toxin subunit A n=1 Tax=Pseudomonas capeferrum TaxID=1495066 RepID=UPI0015E2B6F3|nr:alpha-xenorhabdolysin family binary toxin subunit A [Pseudomonas capeferrum]MBA1203411.1 alpha-xenorhabdolysin family binary toxin subunit A [Pseudomonas capeferrum]
MIAQGLTFERLHEQATTFPLGLIKAMNHREGSRPGGLVLTPEYVRVLSRYAAYVGTLPTDLDQIVAWLGYKTISEPELTPACMRLLFMDLRQHAQRWPVLHEQCHALAGELATACSAIELAGERFRGQFESLRIQRDESQGQATLGEKDLQSVRRMADSLDRMNSDVDRFDQKVGMVRAQCEYLRDHARFTLVPEVHEKNRAAERYQGNGDADNLRWEVSWLDTELSGLRRQYKRYASLSMVAWAGGPLDPIIQRSIYSNKAREARNQYHALEDRRIRIGRLLIHFYTLEGRIQMLRGELEQLELELLDVVTSCAHLQSTWQTVETYIDASRDRLLKAKSAQELRTLVIRFNQFLGQWTSIREEALQMQRGLRQERNPRVGNPADTIN